MQNLLLIFTVHLSLPWICPSCFCHLSQGSSCAPAETFSLSEFRAPYPVHSDLLGYISQHRAHSKSLHFLWGEFPVSWDGTLCSGDRVNETLIITTPFPTQHGNIPYKNKNRNHLIGIIIQPHFSSHAKQNPCTLAASQSSGSFQSVK